MHAEPRSLLRAAILGRPRIVDIKGASLYPSDEAQIDHMLDAKGDHRACFSAETSWHGRSLVTLAELAAHATHVYAHVGRGAINAVVFVTDTERGAEVRGLCVGCAVRSAGLGRGMMQHIMDAHRRPISLSVFDPVDKSARDAPRLYRFYGSLGFERLHREQDYVYMRLL